MEYVKPMDIEKRSFEIITQELGDRLLDKRQAPVIKRVIHTTADFEYADTLCFSDNAVDIGVQALLQGTSIVTDTQMAKSGINKPGLQKCGGEVYCFMSDSDVAASAKERGITRAAVCMEKAAKLQQGLIVVVGNAPTALFRLEELIREEQFLPKLVVGVPVGFVNVVESKELLMTVGVPYIVARGRKGGSNVAAAIVNALLYLANPRETE